MKTAAAKMRKTAAVFGEKKRIPKLRSIPEEATERTPALRYPDQELTYCDIPISILYRISVIAGTGTAVTPGA